MGKEFITNTVLTGSIIDSVYENMNLSLTAGSNLVVYNGDGSVYKDFSLMTYCPDAHEYRGYFAWFSSDSTWLCQTNVPEQANRTSYNVIVNNFYVAFKYTLVNEDLVDHIYRVAIGGIR